MRAEAGMSEQKVGDGGEGEQEEEGKEEERPSLFFAVNMSVK